MFVIRVATQLKCHDRKNFVFCEIMLAIFMALVLRFAVFACGKPNTVRSFRLLNGIVSTPATDSKIVERNRRNRREISLKTSSQEIFFIT